jgi:hypothetical protein
MAAAKSQDSARIRTAVTATVRIEFPASFPPTRGTCLVSLLIEQPAGEMPANLNQNNAIASY